MWREEAGRVGISKVKLQAKKATHFKSKRQK